MPHGLATTSALGTGAQAVLAAAVGALLAAAVLGGLSRLWSRRSGRSLHLDWQGMVLAAGLLVAAYASGRPDMARLGWLALAASVVILPTDWLRRPRGLRLLVALGVLYALSPHRAIISTVKLPFSSTFIDLGWWGWAVSWAWVALFGSMFARSAPVAGVVPGMAVLSGTTMWAICALRPEVTGAAARFASVALAGAGLGTGPFHRHLRDPRSSSGAYVVGMVAGIVAAMGMIKNSAALAILIPLLLVGMPLFAAVGPKARASRRAGRPRHLHEVLIEQGYSEGIVAAVALGGALYLCVLAILLVRIIEWHWAVKLALVVGWAAAGILVGYVLVRLLPRRRAPGAGPAKVRLFGLHLDALTMAQALDRAREFLRSDAPHYIVTCDATAVVRAQEDPAFRDIVNRADLVTADGAGVVLAAKLLGLPVAVRVAGCDMVEGLSRVAAETGQSVYFFGAEEGVAEAAALKLMEQIPGLVVAGHRHGYFSAEEEPAVVRAIADTHPALLFVALGQPRQEQFIAAYLQEIGARIAVGIGGSFDVISGRKRRAPVWMQRFGLEWAYRVAKEPRRLRRLGALPRIVLMAFAEILRGPAAGEDDGVRGAQP